MIYVSGSVKSFPIVVNIVSDKQIANRPITKRLEMFEKHIELYVDGVKVHLKALNIPNEFNYTQHHAVFGRVDTKPFCKGIARDEPARLMVLRKHGDGKSRYHARKCPLVMSFLRNNENCFYCQRALLNSSHAQPTEPVKPETKVVSTDNGVLDIITDWDKILDELFKDGTEELWSFIKAQRQAVYHVKKWDPSIISVCLNLYVRSSRSYSNLTDSSSSFCQVEEQCASTRTSSNRSRASSPRCFRG